MKKSLETQRNTQAVGQLAPSMEYIQEQISTRNITGTPLSGRRKTQFSETLFDKRNKVQVNSLAKHNQNTETVNAIIKSIMVPTHMIIGIRNFNGLQNGKLLIEVHTENDIEALQNQIRDKCG